MMKNIFNFLLILIIATWLSPSVNATCLIDSSEMCISDISRQEFSPLFDSGYTIKDGATISPKMKPLERDDVGNSLDNTRRDNTTNYNSSCQFGVCLPNRTDKLFSTPNK